MSLRSEFVKLALVDGSNISELCRRFDISRKTGYKWIERFCNQGYQGLADHSRRPKTTPRQNRQSSGEMRFFGSESSTMPGADVRSASTCRIWVGNRCLQPARSQPS